MRGSGQTPGEVLKRFREEKGLSQEELGRHLGLTQAMVSRLESDRRRFTGSIYEKMIEIFPGIREPFHEALSFKENSRPIRVPENLVAVPLLTAPDAIAGAVRSVYRIYVLRIHIPDAVGHRLFAVTVTNRTGEPEIRPGGVVVVDTAINRLDRADSVFAMKFTKNDIAFQRGLKKNQENEALGKVIWVGQPL